MVSRIKVILIGTVLVLLLVTACATEATPTPEPTTPASMPTPAPSLSSERTGESTMSQDNIIARGEEIFQKTAGGTGCAVCHGKDGSGVVGPDIRSRSTDDIRDALTSVPDMSHISLKNEDVEAVAAYLKYLAADEGM